ncbi:MAG: effector-associated domain EAD1-containing protein [Cyanobacteria bacterium P01_C01_bin.89]
MTDHAKEQPGPGELDFLEAMQVDALHGHRHIVTCMKWGEKRSRIISGSEDKDVLIWDVDFDLKKQQGPVSRFSKHPARINAVALDQNDEVAISADEYGNIYGWEISPNPTFCRHINCDLSVICFDLAPTKDYLATGSENGLVQVWDWSRNGSNTPMLELRAGKLPINSIEWLKSDTLIAASQDSNIYVWENIRRSQNPVLKTLSAHNDRILDIAISSDEKIMASQAADDTFRLWDLDKKIPIDMYRYQCSRNPNIGISFRNNYFLSMGKGDKVFRTWKLDMDQVLEESRKKTDSDNIAWSKQDRIQILASYDAWSIDYENQIQEACRKAGFYPIFAGDFDIALSFCSKQCSKLSEQILSTFSAALNDRKPCLLLIDSEQHECISQLRQSGLPDAVKIIDIASEPLGEATYKYLDELYQERRLPVGNPAEEPISNVPSQQWTSVSKQVFRDVLIDVYRSRKELEIFCRDTLNHNLEEIVGDGGLKIVAYELIEFAESKGLLDDLHKGFSEENPER